MKFGGEGEIRTRGRLAPTAVFKTAALVHYATSPSNVRRRVPLWTTSPRQIAAMCFRPRFVRTLTFRWIFLFKILRILRKNLDSNVYYSKNEADLVNNGSDAGNIWNEDCFME